MITAWNKSVDWELVKRIVEEHPELDLYSVARRAGVSYGYLSRHFAAMVGSDAGFKKQQIKNRIVKAKKLLTETDKSIVEIAAECGFAHRNHMDWWFRKFGLLSPAEFRKFFKTEVGIHENTRVSVPVGT